MATGRQLIASMAASVAAGVATAYLVDSMRERRQQRRQLPAASVGGPLADVLSATFRAGWYWATVPTVSYSDPQGTPFDTALRGRFVTRATVTSYGPQAARTWILMYVPRPFRGPAAWDLEQWAHWWPAKSTTTIEETIPERGGEDLLTRAGEEIIARADQLGSEAKAAASAVVASVVRPLVVVGGVVVGAVALGLFFRARGART